jgi:hypothetical protein
MKPNLRSRLTGRSVSVLPARIVQDLFAMDNPQESSALRIVPRGLRADIGVAFLGRSPEALETTAIRQVVVTLCNGAPWSRWLEAIPLVAHLDQRVHLHPLEKEALTHLPHLQHICHRPRLHLRVEEERVQVARARRIPARAAATLVAHPEDWEHRTLRSILPTKVLSVQVEDEWNLYENRVAVRLVDHLLSWTGKRLDELRRIAAMAHDGRGFDDETSGSRFRGKRLYTLWGKFCTDDALTRELERTLKTLEHLQEALQALLASPLYREIPRGTFVPAALIPTNILANDPHYRKVAVLWRAWARYGHVPGVTREELRSQRQTDCRNFDMFSLLVVVHALEGAGYEAQPDAALPGGGVELNGPLGRARLTAKEGAIGLAIEGKLLRIVPILAPIDREDATVMWEQIHADADRSLDTVVLLLGRPEDLGRLEPRTARALGGWERPRVLAISPWSLDCAERVARVLREWEALHRFAGYPPRAVVQPDPGITLPAWMRRTGTFIAVVEPAPPEQRSTFIHACDKKADAVRREQEAAHQAKRAFDPGRVKAIAALRELAEAAQQLDPWRACPVCKNASNTDFEPRVGKDERWDGWSWWCRCKSCSSQWGTWVCSACQRSFPVLAPNVRRSSSGEDSPPVGWLDRVYGSDLWAETCWKQDAANVFRCTRCGACPVGKCARCA